MATQSWNAKPGQPIQATQRDWNGGIRPGLGGSRYELRIGDAEREAAASQLGEHFVAGRLTLEELHGRLGAVFAAKTQEQISAVMADLPPSPRRISHPPRPRTSTGVERGRYAALALLVFAMLVWMISVAVLARHGAYPGYVYWPPGRP